MQLYHAGFQEIKNPDVHYGRKNADFGQGFYLTVDEEFARRWARERKGDRTVINEYSLETEGLNVVRFTRSEEWFRYIFANRAGKLDSIDADVIIGPIANDTIYDTLGIFTSGFLSDEEALRLLMVGPEYQQVVLKTEKAAAQLTWKSAIALRSDLVIAYRLIVAEEEKEYLKAVAEEMERFEQKEQFEQIEQFEQKERFEKKKVEDAET